MNKSKPHTIRFDQKEYDFICKREGLKTAQSILNFLVSEYMKLYKVEKPSIFSVEQTTVFDGPNLPNNSNEPGQWQKPKIHRSFENYMQLRKECENEEDWNDLKEEILNSDLSTKQKTLLTN